MLRAPNLLFSEFPQLDLPFPLHQKQAGLELPEGMFRGLSLPCRAALLLECQHGPAPLLAAHTNTNTESCGFSWFCLQCYGPGPALAGLEGVRGAADPPLPFPLYGSCPAAAPGSVRGL